MPTYFIENELTTEQKTRWDDAIVEYTRVQQANLERKFSRITQEDRDFYATKLGAKTDDEIREKMRALGGLLGNSPGHPKSALFARLLDGKAALPFPPPTNHSYPWYSVIDDAGPHYAMLGGMSTVGGVLSGTRGAVGDYSISINQCLWAVKSTNAAALRLLDLDVELQTLGQMEGPGDHNSSMVYNWTEDFLSRVKAAYAEGPEFVVQHGEWPDFRLFVTQSDRYCHKSLMKYFRSKMDSPVSHLKRTWSVFDLDALNLNARIGRTLRKGKHPKIRLEEAEARCAEYAGASINGLPAQLDRAAVEKAIESLDDDVREFEANPDIEDWVEVYLDNWYLVKGSE